MTTLCRMYLVERCVNHCIVENGAVGSDAMEAKVGKRGQTALARDLVPLLVKARTLAPEDQHAKILCRTALITGGHGYTTPIGCRPPVSTGG